MFTLALEYLKVAISLKPNDYLLWNALGVVAAHPGRLEDVIIIYKFCVYSFE